MIEFAFEDGMIGHKLKIYPEKVVYERYGYKKPTKYTSIDIGCYIEFLSLLKLHELKSKYARPILDGWSWKLEKNKKLISEGYNKIPDQVRQAINYLSQEIKVSFIPSLQSETGSSDFQILLD